MNINLNVTELSDMAINFGTKVLYAIIVFVLGLLVIKMITKSFKRALAIKKIDQTLEPFLVSIVNAILKVALLISVLGMVGVKTTSFVAVIGAAGLAVGLALQGSLSNFAGSVLILVFKPFKVGDFIQAQGHSGTVNEIGLFTTRMKTGDNKTIFLPNGPLAGGSMINFSYEDLRRLDMVFGIGYDDNIQLAKDTLSELIEKDERVLKDKDRFVRVTNLGESSVDLTIRVWVNKDDYWSLHWDMLEQVKLTFDEKGLSFPFPQRDVHHYNHNQTPMN